MIREELSAGLSQVGLGIVGSYRAVAETVLPHLLEGETATFFPDPADLVQNPGEWRALMEMGHELGNGALVAATLEDGSLPRWTPGAFTFSIESADELLFELLDISAPLIAVPNGPPDLADGSSGLAQLKDRTLLYCGPTLDPTELGGCRVIPWTDSTLDRDPSQWGPSSKIVLKLDASVGVIPGLLQVRSVRLCSVNQTLRNAAMGTTHQADEENQVSRP